MAGMAAVGLLSYNGYTFSGERNVTVETRPQYDEAGRVQIYVVTTLRVTATIALDPNTNTTLDSIRCLLTESGGLLLYSGDGFGVLNVNTPNNPDVNWGPKPQVLAWQPTGSARACEIEWEVECCTACCAQFNANALVMAFNYSVSFARNKFGDVTRTVSGHIIVSSIRLPGQRTVSRSADDAINLIQVVAPIGFSRTKFDRTLSLDKSRMDFTIVDEQIYSRNAYPRFCIEISASQSVEFARANGVSVRSSMSMDITVQRESPRFTAWHVFLFILDERIQIAKRNGMTVLIESVSAEEDIFGFSGRFRANFRIITGTEEAGFKDVFKDMVYKTGMFRNVSTDWALWRDSLATSMFNTLGTSGLRMLPGQDSIVNLCSGNDFVLRLGATELPPAATNDTEVPKITNVAPPPEKSYIHYDTSITLDSVMPTTTHSPLQAQSPDTTFVDFVSPGAAESASIVQPFSLKGLGSSGIGGGLVGGLSNTIQTRGEGRHIVRTSGTAIRAGHPIPRPGSGNFFGRVAKLTGSAFVHLAPTNVFGVLFHSMKWDAEYTLDGPPQGVVPPPAINER